MALDGKIFVAGHNGLVGSALVRRLGRPDLLLRSRTELDLTNQAAVNAFFEQERPDFVFLAAARVGGIHANNTYPADFIRDNLFIAANVIDASHRFGVKKLVVLGSSCIYPRLAKQPMTEDQLLAGPLEPTNEAYAVAKIAGIKMAQAYHKQFGLNAINLMPTNLYGPGDNFDLQSSHVLPALICKFHEARESGADHVTLWGTGSPRREFLHCDDLASAVVFLAETYDRPEVVNIGVGEDLSIRELAELIARTVGFQGELRFDTSMPDGTPRKLLDVSRLTSLGWKPSISLAEGVRTTYAWFLENQAHAHR